GAFWLYALHQQHNRKFCMRVKTSQMNAAKRFIESGQKQQTITLKANKASITTCLNKGLNHSDIQLRFVRVDLESDVEVLITNLDDEQAFPPECFKGLYHLRWGIEENKAVVRN
ncbi:MAG: transposase, partial [Thiomicrorhabdus sp.]|nr:transposase [Thiomicrorhabdus sp.]